MDDDHHKIISLYKAILLLEHEDEMRRFFKDICTPAEIRALEERWRVCQLLNRDHSYREISKKTGASLTTIGRVARFLREEQNEGYITLLKKIKKE